MNNTQKTGFAVGVLAAIFLGIVFGLWLVCQWEAFVERREQRRRGEEEEEGRELEEATPPAPEEDATLPPPAPMPGGFFGYVSIIAIPPRATLQPGMVRDSLEIYHRTNQSETFVQALSV